MHKNKEKALNMCGDPLYYHHKKFALVDSIVASKIPIDYRNYSFYSQLLVVKPLKLKLVIYWSVFGGNG